MQIVGFYLQTVPVAVLFWSEIPEEYLKKSYRKMSAEQYASADRTASGASGAGADLL